jgi:hypothetical protein
MTKISYARYRFPPEIIPRQISYDLLQGHGRARALRSRNREAVMMATGNDLRTNFWGILAENMREVVGNPNRSKTAPQVRRVLGRLLVDVTYKSGTK